MTSDSASRTAAIRSLSLVLGAAFVSWLLFVAGRYVSVAFEVETFGAAMYTDTGAESVDYTESIAASQYFTFAAIALFGLVAVFAKRTLIGVERGAAVGAGAASTPAAAQQSDGSTRTSALVAPVKDLASTAIIISAALGVIAALTLFMGGFFSGASFGDAAPAVLPRLINAYLPIVLYAALVISLILVGFVFTQAVRRTTPEHADSKHTGPQHSNLQHTDLQRTEAPPTETRDPRRALAFAYALPIVAAAVAFIFGLVVYDLTRTTLQVWVWVAILLIIGLGIAFGTRFARAAAQGEAAHSPVVGGARLLNFLLGVVFTVAAVCMSLGYGTSAVHSLNASPSLELSAWGENENWDDNDESVKITDPQISLWGSDLQRGSEGSLVLEPGGEVIATVRTDGDRWLSADAPLPKSLEPGDYRIIATGTAVDGSELSVEMPFTVTEQGSVDFTKGSSHSADVESNLLPLTAGWFFGDLVPAAVLLLLGCGLVAVTVTTRNRD